MEFKIGAVSKMTGLSPSGIRFLEEQGLLSPSGGRKGSNRSFSLADVSTLLDYRNYRKCGFTQDEILTLIRNEDQAIDAMIFDERCKQLEEDILQSTRLLHFLHRRARDVSAIREAETFFEITERPAIIWMPLKDTKGSMAEWPEDSGFEIPYTDSVLLFDHGILAASEDHGQAVLGIGILEEDVLHSSFLGQEEAVYLGAHKAVHCIVEITDDFRIQEDSLLRCQRRLNDMLQGQTKAIHLDQRVITRRIITEKTSGRFCRYDHLWIDIDV